MSSKNAEASCLSRTASGILNGIGIRTEFLPDNCGELGYTSGNLPVTIHVAWYEDIFFKELDEAEQSMLRMGIGAHETLHQVFTDFIYTQNICKSMSNAEASIFMTFANTIEDPAIEYFAPKVMGGWFLDALRFSIRHIYIKSPKIDDISENAFSQLVNALIQFGDMGVVKGTFTFPEARKYFNIVAPLYNKAITCPNSKTRIDIAKQCMELTRPLWEEAVKEREFFEKLLKELADALKKTGLHLGADMESEMSSEDGDDSGSAARRKIAVEKIEAFNQDSSDSEEDDSNKGSTSADAESENMDLKDGNSADISSSKDEKASDTKNSDEKSKDHTDAESKDTEKADDELCVSPEEAEKIAKDTYEVTKEDLEYVKQNIESAQKAESKASTNSKDEEFADYDIKSTAFKHASCHNTRPRVCDKSATKDIYMSIANSRRAEIKNLEKRLLTIFEADREENTRSTSGSYNILRGSVGTSVRMFDKIKDKGKTKDLEIFLCVDLSGSMYGEKEKQARETSIIFAEALTSLKIPYYIMGFSADKEADADHYHFVDWNNRTDDRYSLAAMRAGGNNFDGYSIRYATEILKSRPASNKILFIISDGEPACSTYSLKTGIADTINAIKESRKYVRTFGIAFGTGCNPNVLQTMYGADFIHCADVSLLTNTLTKKLAKMIKKGR